MSLIAASKARAVVFLFALTMFPLRVPAESLSAARESGRSFVCAYSVPSFFGERTLFEAKIIGPDFIAKESQKEGSRNGLHYARVGGWGYMWFMDSDVPATKFDLVRFSAAYQQIYGYPKGSWSRWLVFEEPTDDAECIRSKPFSLQLPELSFTDVTSQRIQDFRDRFLAKTNHFDGYSFRKVLPVPRPRGFDRLHGYVNKDSYGIKFSSESQGEYSHLRITFSKTPKTRRPENCWARWKPDCEVIAVTPQGRKIFTRWVTPDSSSSNELVREYYADVDETLVVLRWVHYSYAENKVLYRTHEFNDNTLEALFDSLEVVESEDVVRFPDMYVPKS